MALREKLYTAEEFFQIAAQPENDEKRLELDDGKVVEIAPSSPLNSVTGARIGYFLNSYVIPNRCGYVSGADGAFKLTSNRVRFPNAAFVSLSHNIEWESAAFTFAPDLAIEIVSPDEDIFKKALEYLHGETKMVWAVYTDEKTVHVMRLDEDGGLRSTPFGIDTVLDGGDVLPGFSLAVKDIFPD